MKAEELFVGALVCVNRDGLCIRKGTIIEVRGIDADDKLAEKGLVGSAHCRPLDDDQFEGGIWCEYLDPIPLTPEILEKNGWKCFCTYNKYRVYSHPKAPFDILQRKDGGYTIEADSVEGGAWFLFILYVHQLQHAIRLCGIEKEITI